MDYQSLGLQCGPASETSLIGHGSRVRGSCRKPYYPLIPRSCVAIEFKSWVLSSQLNGCLESAALRSVVMLGRDSPPVGFSTATNIKDHKENYNGRKESQEDFLELHGFTSRVPLDFGHKSGRSSSWLARAGRS